MNKEEIFAAVALHMQKGLELLQKYDQGESIVEKETQVNFLSVKDVIDLHNLASNQPVINKNALDSAVHRPVQAEHYSSPTIYELAVILAEGIIRNHPFADGNKRCALLSMCAFLAVNGHPVPEDSEQAAKIVLGLTERKITALDAARYIEMCQSEFIEMPEQNQSCKM